MVPFFRFFRFDLEEALFVQAILFTKSSEFRIDLCHTDNAIPCTLFGECKLWPSFRYDIGKFDRGKFVFIESMFENEPEWEAEMPKYELWPRCLKELTRTLEVASVMLI